MEKFLEMVENVDQQAYQRSQSGTTAVFGTKRLLPGQSHRQAVHAMDRDGATERRTMRMWMGSIFFLLAGLILVGIPLSTSSWAQTEVTSDIARFRERRTGTKSYERYEVKPRAHLPFVKGQIPRAALIDFAPTAERIRIRKYLADAHMGLKFYERLTCIDCHPEQARDIHTVRERLTCRQCHGGEPIAGIRHYYSTMNPRRRYAFVCAKCHEGASASFATYVIHPPNPVSLSTWRSFPALSLVFWLMIAVAAGTFLVFLPHTILWVIRELLLKKENH